MFTGIIEEIGTIEKIIFGRESRSFFISAKRIMDDLAIDHSVSIDGVCLTVTSLSAKGFETTAVSNTVERSVLGHLKSGVKVNLERALRVGDRLGGHCIQGHVDGIGKLIAIRQRGNTRFITCQIPNELVVYVIPRGSVAINGVSLTVAEMSANRIILSIIPHTINQTTFQYLKEGAFVNFEADMVGKYIEKFCQHHFENKKNSRWIDPMEQGLE